MNRRLAEKVCVITGAASGLGAETASRFRDEGATVVGWDLTPPAGVDLAAPVDVTDESSVATAVAELLSRYGRLDVLVNYAGILPADDGSVLDTTPATWRRVLDVNVIGVLNCCKHGIPPMLAAGVGSVVNISSVTAVCGSAVSQIAYTASKGAVLSLSRELAVEFASRGVRVNALCPGPVGTDMTASLYERGGGGQDHRLRYIPMGRLATPAEIANSALFLASDEASYVNGAALLVDGAVHSAYIATAGPDIATAGG